MLGKQKSHGVDIGAERQPGLFFEAMAEVIFGDVHDLCNGIQREFTGEILSDIIHHLRRETFAGDKMLVGIVKSKVQELENVRKDQQRRLVGVQLFGNGRKQLRKRLIFGIRAIAGERRGNLLVEQA